MRSFVFVVGVYVWAMVCVDRRLDVVILVAVSASFYLTSGLSHY